MNTKIDALNYYGATKKYPLHFPALQDDIDADVVIIGGGFQASIPRWNWRSRGSLMLSFWKPAILGMAAPGETAVR